MKVIKLLPRLLFSLMFVTSLSAALLAQEQKPPSAGEVEAAKKVQDAQGLPAKLKQAEEFMKKNAKSSLRIKVAEYLAAEVGDVADSSQRLGYIEQYKKIFSDDKEKDLVLAYQVDSLALTDKVEEAFKLAPKALEKSPDNALLLTQLALRGANLVRQGKEELAAPTKQYGTKAVELIEADKKPANVNDQFWADFRQKWLPELYQSLGFVAFAQKDMADAKAKFQKAVDLNLQNPNGYLMLGSIANDEYQKYAMEYNTASGPAKDAALQKAQQQLDQVIDYYAHVIALAAPKPELKQLHDQVLPVLQEYYKFRKGSLDGLQQLIDKYKK
jgi:tetratricopeptide (TPR) repeat protein